MLWGMVFGEIVGSVVAAGAPVQIELALVDAIA